MWWGRRGVLGWWLCRKWVWDGGRIAGKRRRLWRAEEMKEHWSQRETLYGTGAVKLDLGHMAYSEGI